MATTSSRALTLLSLLRARAGWSGRDLADSLDVSTRTVRRDIDSLRALGYAIHATKGPDASYQLEVGGNLPPLSFDGEQLLAIAIALRTAPVTVAGRTDAAARALLTIEQLMPASLRAEAEALRSTMIRNYWEFAAPPIAYDRLKTVGGAVRESRVLRFDYLTEDGHRPSPGDRDFSPPLCVEPHHLALWAGRWYLVAYQLATGEWGVYRVERIWPKTSTGPKFGRRPLPARSVAHYIMTTHDRGDTTPDWECLGSAVMDLSADVIARWAPGGAIIEYISPNQARITLGAWSWAGIAGLLATFDADITRIEPDELKQACRLLADRYQRAVGNGAG